MDTPPDSRKFRLVFTGECYPGHDPQAVRDAVVAALKLDDKRAARLFSGRRVVVRRGVDLPSAHRYIVRLSALGAVVHAEPPLPAQLPTWAAERPTARRTPWWQRRSLAAFAGVSVAMALVLVPATGYFWPDSGLPAPAPQTPQLPSPLPTPLPSAVAPAPPPVAATEAAQKQGDADLPEDMSADARREYLGRYLQAPGHKAFAISASRHHVGHTGAASPAEAREVALNDCLAALRPGDEPCRVIDEDGQLQE